MKALVAALLLAAAPWDAARAADPPALQGAARDSVFEAPGVLEIPSAFT